MEKRRIVQFDMNGNALAVFDNVDQASSSTGVPRPQIIACLKGAWRSTYGYQFKYEVTNAELKAKKREEKKKKAAEIWGKWK